MAETLRMSAADRAMMHALSYLVSQVMRDATTDDALAVLDDLRGRITRANPHVSAMADTVPALLLHGSRQSGLEWAMAIMEAGRAIGAYHYAQMAAQHLAARPDRGA
jgi:hypothetical protein